MLLKTGFFLSFLLLKKPLETGFFVSFLLMGVLLVATPLLSPAATTKEEEEENETNHKPKPKKPDISEYLYGLCILHHILYTSYHPKSSVQKKKDKRSTTCEAKLN